MIPPVLKAPLGGRIELSGRARPKIVGAATPTAVEITITRREGISDPIVEVVAVSNGSWRLEWTPPSAGTWQVRADARVPSQGPGGFTEVLPAYALISVTPPPF